MIQQFRLSRVILLLLTLVLCLVRGSSHVVFLLHGVRDGIVSCSGHYYCSATEDPGLTLLPSLEVPVRAEVQIVAVPHEYLLPGLYCVDTSNGRTQTKPASR